jgi:integrase
MTNVSKRIKHREIPTEKEIEKTLHNSEKIKSDYFRLRVRALISLVKKFGKRRAEVVSLKLSDMETKEGYLYVTFTLRKKHKKGLFQFIKQLRKTDPSQLTKPLAELEAQWKLWQLTELGFSVKEEKRTKRVLISDKWAKMILEYVDYLKAHNPEGIYLFPSGKAVFDNYIILNDKSLSGRQLLRLIKPLNKKLWLHLFREMKGAEIARDLGNNLTALTTVKQTLDLENEETAYRYIERYSVQEMKPELD